MFAREYTSNPPAPQEDVLAFARSVGYTLYIQGVRDINDELYQRVLQVIARHRLVFASLDERGEFFYHVGKGYEVAESEGE